MVAASGIAILGGTGDQGFGLALRWAKAGERVLIGSRQKSKATEAATRVREVIGGDVAVEGLENPDAVARTNLVVLTVPFTAQLPILKSVKNSFKPGDLLIDVTVPLEAVLGGRATRILGVWAGSAAEQAAEAVPKEVEVVSAFHNVSALLLQELSQPVESDVIVCGNSQSAKEVVRSLVEQIPGAGFVDGGPIENSRTVEALTALLVSINLRYKVHGTGIRITGLPRPQS